MQIHLHATNLVATLGLLKKASPRAFNFTVVANLLVGLIPGTLVYIGAQLIEQISDGDPVIAVLPLIIAYILLSGFQDSLTAVASFVVDTLQDSVRMQVNHEVNRTIATYADLRIHETPDLRETAVLASQAGNRIGDLVAHTYYVCLGFVMIIPVLVLTGSIAWWIPGFMLMGMLPLAVVRARAERASWDVQEHHAETFNNLQILQRVLLQPPFAKDLRMYHMQSRLLKKWRDHYLRYLHEVKWVRVRNAFGLGLTALFTSVCLAVPFYVVVTGYHSGQFSLADVVIVLGSLLQIKEGLSAMVFNFGDMQGVSYAVQPYRQLLALVNKPAQAEGLMPVCQQYQVHFEKVSFNYQEDSPLVLKQIDLHIAPKETVVLVGDNGAGKTSLLKLLCGFYTPTAGQISWATAGRVPKVVGVFQDFARFPLTPMESLATDNLSLAISCLEAVGLGFLQHRLDYPLSPEMTHGIDLSGGQWQRLAIARAMVHAQNADALVFDEPTAALDPESEAAIMQLILELSAQKSTLIASHRLALTRHADRIVVLDHGCILEQGTHDALMQKNGKYARMFLSQAQFYQ